MSSNVHLFIEHFWARKQEKCYILLEFLRGGYENTAQLYNKAYEKEMKDEISKLYFREQYVQDKTVVQKYTTSSNPTLSLRAAHISLNVAPISIILLYIHDIK